MTRAPLVSVSMLALVYSAGVAVADQSPAIAKPPAAAPAASAIEISLATVPGASAPKVRPVSTAMAAHLAALSPKFKPAKPAGPDSQPDLRETDKPRNTILRLPKYLVQEDPPPTFKPRELRTPQERVALGYRKHPGLHLGNIWIFRNDGIAAAMIAEEERLERMQEMEDLASLMSIADQKKVKPLVQQTFMRQPGLR